MSICRVSIPQAVGTIAIVVNSLNNSILNCVVSIPQAVGTIAMPLSHLLIFEPYSMFQYRKR